MICIKLLCNHYVAMNSLPQSINLQFTVFVSRRRTNLCFAILGRKMVPRILSADLSELRHPSRIQRSFLWLSRAIGRKKFAEISEMRHLSCPYFDLWISRTNNKELQHAFSIKEILTWFFYQMMFLQYILKYLSRYLRYLKEYFSAHKSFFFFKFLDFLSRANVSTFPPQAFMHSLSLMHNLWHFPKQKVNF